jgi:hypothetical protein
MQPRRGETSIAGGANPRNTDTPNLSSPEWGEPISAWHVIAYAGAGVAAELIGCCFFALTRKITTPTITISAAIACA